MVISRDKKAILQKPQLASNKTCGSAEDDENPMRGWA
jgi:hypothetical protein